MFSSHALALQSRVTAHNSLPVILPAIGWLSVSNKAGYYGNANETKSYFRIRVENHGRKKRADLYYVPGTHGSIWLQ